jgi:Mlc titration factor MtfA (ptsG expression regulator)
LRARESKGRPVLRDYAATNEAEFFAVATEVFFERSGMMKRRAPDLYEELHRFYGFDPAGEDAKKKPPSGITPRSG